MFRITHAAYIIMPDLETVHSMEALKISHRAFVYGVWCMVTNVTWVCGVLEVGSHQ